jgi:hypothetical protein
MALIVSGNAGQKMIAAMNTKDIYGDTRVEFWELAGRYNDAD